MHITVLKSKLHRAVVTDADLNYVGSITIDEALMDAADVVPFEKVQVVNNNNGARFETYVIKGERGSGTICVNGAAARLVQKGDVVIILSYCSVSREEAVGIRPKVVLLDEQNRIAGENINATVE
ncbi:MAG TPA: aspartate 1-decarboxylase [Clostridia bacterium]|nr:aspartate 1-decarboxylase [Clostridia bacterium]